MANLKCWKNKVNKADYKVWKNKNKDVAVFRNSVVIGNRRYISKNQTSALKRANSYMKSHDKC